MNIIVGCECTGFLSEALASAGHNVTSVDLRPGDNISRRTHIQTDVFEIATSRAWDMGLFFPPCTYLCNAQAGRINEPGRKTKQSEAIKFVRRLYDLPYPLAIENPIGCLSTQWKKPDQIIYPWQFGDPYSKDICFWLKNLPPLSLDLGITRPETLKSVANHVNSRMSQVTKSYIKSSWKYFPGLIKAIVNQWTLSPAVKSPGKRHTCIVCGRKRYEQYMERINILNAYEHWACKLSTDKNGLWALVTNETCYDKLSALNGQLRSLQYKELFKKLFISRSVV